MLRRIAIPILTLTGMFGTAAASQARAAVRVGVYAGTPAYAAPAPDPYCAPAVIPYAYAPAPIYREDRRFDRRVRTEYRDGRRNYDRRYDRDDDRGFRR